MTDKPNLTKLIVYDIFHTGKIAFTLLILIFIVAMSIVFVTHDTRQLISEKDKVFVERQGLDSEWRNLILEENSLDEHSRVYELATKELDMQRPDPDKEVVIASDE